MSKNHPIVILCLLFSLSSARADDEPRRNPYLVFHRPESTTRRTVKCDHPFSGFADPDFDELSDIDKARLRTDPTAVYNCRVEDVQISKKAERRTKTASDISAERQYWIDSLQKEATRHGGWAKFKSTWMDQWRSSARQVLAMQRAVDASPERRKALDDREVALTSLLNEFSACGTLECMADRMVKRAPAILDESDDTCEIDVYNFRVSLKRDGTADRWTSVTGPTGSCGTVTNIVLEYDKKQATWIYRAKWMYTSPQSDVCGADGTETWYTDFRYSSRARMDCKYVAPIGISGVWN